MDIIYKNIEIDAKNLHENSRQKVFVECDICHTEKQIEFSSYTDNIKRGGLYTCIKCKYVKSIKTHIEKHGGFFNNRKKCKNTNLEKYGCENVSGSKIIKDKKRETNLKNWGVENVFQSELIKGSSKKTLLDKYGVEHPLQNNELLEKSKQTCLKNNGVEFPMESKKIMKKSRQSNLDKYGKEYFTQTDMYKDSVKKSNFKKYGTEWYLGSEDFKNKSKKYYMDNFGVEYNMQNETIYMKAQMSGQKAKTHEVTGLFYRGSYEEDFLDFCFLNKLHIEKGKKFTYFYDGRKRYYYSDFYLPDKNLVIEIKSDYYMIKYYEMNMAKKESTMMSGYNFLFILNKNYDEFFSLLKSEGNLHHQECRLA